MITTQKRQVRETNDYDPKTAEQASSQNSASCNGACVEPVAFGRGAGPALSHHLPVPSTWPQSAPSAHLPTFRPPRWTLPRWQAHDADLLAVAASLAAGCRAGCWRDTCLSAWATQSCSAMAGIRSSSAPSAPSAPSAAPPAARPPFFWPRAARGRRAAAEWRARARVSTPAPHYGQLFYPPPSTTLYHPSLLSVADQPDQPDHPPSLSTLSYACACACVWTEWQRQETGTHRQC